jgi:drug/metabolite transporter (DMT)-like permease
MKSRIVWLLLCCIWGSTWLFIKIGLRDLPPISFAAIRFLIAVIILAAIILVRRLALPRSSKDWWMLAGTGVLAFSLNYGLIFWGEQYISSGLAALLQATIPAFGLVIAHIHLPAERMTPLKFAGVILGIAGVGVIFSNQLTFAGPKALAGSIALVISSICVAYSNVLVKAYAKNIEPTVIAGGQMFFGLIPLAIIGLATDGNPINLHWTRLAIISLFYLAITGSVIAFILYYWLVRRIDVTKSMLIALVTPVTAVILGMLVLHEEMNWRTLVGGALIISGIAMLVIHRRKREATLIPES